MSNDRLIDGTKALRASQRFYSGEPLPSRKQEQGMAGRRKGKSRRDWQQPRMLGTVARTLGQIR